MEVSLQQYHPPPATVPSQVRRKQGSRTLHAPPLSVKGTPVNQRVLKAVAPPPTDWRSSTNIYIKGLPETCIDDDLLQWAAVVAEPVSVKTIRESGQEQKCTGIGFVRFYENSHATAFLQLAVVSGFEACFAKETYIGKIERAADNRSANLYLSHIPLTYEEDEVAALFPPNRYSIQSLRLLHEGDQPHKRAHGTAFRGAGFVRLATRRQADEAIAELNGKYLPGHQRLKNGYFETLQVRIADTDAQKMIKESMKGKASSRLALATHEHESHARKAPTSPVQKQIQHHSGLSMSSISSTVDNFGVRECPPMSPPRAHSRWYSDSPETGFGNSSSWSAYSSPATSRGSPVQTKYSPTIPFVQDLPPYVPAPPAPLLPSAATFPPALPTFPLPAHGSALLAGPVLPPVPSSMYTSDPIIASLLASAYQQGQSDAHVQQSLSFALLQQHQQLQMHSQQLQETINYNQHKLDIASGSGYPGEVPKTPYYEHEDDAEPARDDNTAIPSLANYRFGSSYTSAEESNTIPVKETIGLGIAHVTVLPETPSSKQNRPRAYTSVTSDTPSKLLAPDSALGRRSSALEARILKRKESLSLVPAVLELRRASIGSNSSSSLSPSPTRSSHTSPRPSISIDKAPVEVERMGAPKVILPFSKAIRSFSVAALDDSGFHDNNIGGEAHEPPQLVSPTVPAYRRSSHLGTSSSSYVPEQGRLVRMNSNSSVHKTLRETFSNMSLRNGSTVEEQEEEQPMDEADKGSLTQIKPGFKFGTSYDSKPSTSPTSSLAPVFRRLSAAQQPTIQFSSLENGDRRASVAGSENTSSPTDKASRRDSGFNTTRDEDLQTEYMMSLLGGETS